MIVEEKCKRNDEEESAYYEEASSMSSILTVSSESASSGSVYPILFTNHYLTLATTLREDWRAARACLRTHVLYQLNIISCAAPRFAYAPGTWPAHALISYIAHGRRLRTTPSSGRLPYAHAFHFFLASYRFLAQL